MKKVPTPLPTDVSAIQEMVVQLRAQVDNLEQENQKLSEQFKLAQRKQFGQSSEGHLGQGELFNEVEELVESVISEQDTIE